MTGTHEDLRKLTMEFRRASAVISCDAVQKLIACWRATGMPITSVTADIKNTSVVIRIGVSQVTREILRDMRLEICGFEVMVEHESLRVLH